MAGDGDGLKWAVPEGMEIPRDPLRFRLDIHEETVILHQFGDGATTTRVVSALDVARAFTRQFRLSSGLLPEGALWWSMGPEGAEVALWRGRRVWRVALVEKPFQPPRRLSLPMPGLVFVCSPGRPPRVYAAKRPPVAAGDMLYHAPLFNLFRDGRSCPGTHKYPERVEEVPESFFTAFFTRRGEPEGRSRKYPKDLLARWETLDRKGRFPLRDLMPLGTIGQVLGQRPE